MAEKLTNLNLTIPTYTIHHKKLIEFRILLNYDRSSFHSDRESSVDGKELTIIKSFADFVKFRKSILKNVSRSKFFFPKKSHGKCACRNALGVMIRSSSFPTHPKWFDEVSIKRCAYLLENFVQKLVNEASRLYLDESLHIPMKRDCKFMEEVLKFLGLIDKTTFAPRASTAYFGLGPTFSNTSEPVTQRLTRKPRYTTLPKLMIQESASFDSPSLFAEKARSKILNAYQSKVDELSSPGISDERIWEICLYLACQKGKAQAAKAILSHGVSPNSSLANGTSSLSAASRSGSIELVNLLIKGGANVNMPNSSGVTPLIIACRKGHSEIVQVLLQNGANISHVSKKGTHALFAAVLSNSSQTVELLLEECRCMKSQQAIFDQAIALSIRLHLDVMYNILSRVKQSYLSDSIALDNFVPSKKTKRTLNFQGKFQSACKPIHHNFE